MLTPIVLFAFFIGFISFLTPTGPITILIFRNTLLGKYGKAIMIIFGAAIIQFFLAGFSLFLINTIISEKVITISRVISSIVFLILGIHLIISKPRKAGDIINLKELPHKEKLKSFLTGILLTLLNPGIIFSWLAIITLLISFNYITITTLFDILIFSISALIGVLSGSFLMMFLIHNRKKTISDKIIKKILKILGIFIIALAFYFLFSAIYL